MLTLEDAPFLDIFELRADQRERQGRIAALQRETWIVRTLAGGIVIGREQVQALLSDRRLCSSVVSFIEMQGVTDGLVHDRMVKTLLAIDGEAHSRVRTLVRKAFVPAAVDRHRPLMRSIITGLVEPVRSQGRCDFMAAVAEHYPIEVMCHVLGVPTDDHEEFTTWIKAISWTLGMDLAQHVDEAEWGMKQIDDYASVLIADRQARPRDDLVTMLVQAEEAGDRLDEEELRSLIMGLLFAGYDTTRNQLGLAVHTFAEHPEQWALLARRPELAPKAVEEVMRYSAAVPLAPRLVAEDFDFCGYHFTKGTHLSLSTAAANHDPAAFRDPDSFDITAEREPQLTFGGGPHYCLGAWLARAEMQEALPLLAQAMPDLALDGEPVWRPPLGIFGPDKLPIRFRAA